MRPEEINQQFNAILDKHLEEIARGETDVFLQIHDIANMVNIHPIHLSNTIKDVTGKSPCDICNAKTIDFAKQLLNNNDITIASVARKLTFDPTNFTKYFKKHTGKTPSEYRKK